MQLAEARTVPNDCNFFDLLECEPGYRWQVNPNNVTCIPGPIGSYRDTDKVLECTQCPTSHTTDQEGSTSRSDCVIRKEHLSLRLWLICDSQELLYCLTGSFALKILEILVNGHMGPLYPVDKHD